tara:strand:- start:6417 stop:7220 length:804 start_codon:yes stop_codon:yes gene_type:complete
MNQFPSLISCIGRNLILTGATGFLGQTITKLLAEIGYNLIIVDLDTEKLSKLKNDLIKSYDIKVDAITCNLEIEEDRNNLIKIIKDNYSQINCLINNAAFVGTRNLAGWNVPFEDQSLNSWRRCFEVNLCAPFHLIQQISPLMKESLNASIINVGSIYGHYAPDWNLYNETEINNIAAYSTSKGGIIQLTRWLSTTLAPKIRVNAISPGGILRNQSKNFIEKYSSKAPLKRMANEEDLIGAFTFLSTDMSLYVTGQTLKIDGGWGLS